MISEATVLALCALILGSFGGLLSCVLRSRCKTIDCCCLKCERDVLDNVSTTVDLTPRVSKLDQAVAPSVTT